MRWVILLPAQGESRRRESVGLDLKGKHHGSGVFHVLDGRGRDGEDGLHGWAWPWAGERQLCWDTERQLSWVGTTDWG
jgi:hypothetical protein